MGRGILWRLLLGVSVMAVLPLTLSAENLPSFSVYASGWAATDIVVVQDDTVKSVWKGKFTVGDRSPMQQFTPRDPNVYYGFGRKRVDAEKLPQGAVQKVSGRRCVLLLVRNNDGRYRPADADFYVSTVWIEDDKCYSVQQIRNPGPALVRPMWRGAGHGWAIMSEAQLQARVKEVCDTQARFNAADQLEDPTARAKALLKFHLDSGAKDLGSRVRQSLIDCGEPAWPVVRPFLFDAKYLAAHDSLISVGFQIGPTLVVPEMERIVQDETEIWRTIVQDKAKESVHQPPLSHHFDRLDSALWTLRKAKYRDSMHIVASLRQLWNSSDELRTLRVRSRSGKTVSPILVNADEILGNPPAPLKLPPDRRGSIKDITEIADKAIEELLPRKDYMLVVASARYMQFRHPALEKFPEYKAALDQQLGRIRNALREATGDKHPEVWKTWKQQIEDSPPILSD